MFFEVLEVEGVVRSYSTRVNPYSIHPLPLQHLENTLSPSNTNKNIHTTPPQEEDVEALTQIGDAILTCKKIFSKTEGDLSARPKVCLSL